MATMYMNMLIRTLLLCTLLSNAAASEGVKFSMRNLCGESVRVYWVGFDNELVPQSKLPSKNSSSISINSYRGHRFLVWYNRGTEEEVQRDARVHGSTYTVGDTNDIVTVEEGLVFIRHDANQRSLEATEYAVRSCDPRGFDDVGSFDLTCVKDSIADWMTSRREELDFEWSIYSNLKKGLESYKKGNGHEDDIKYEKVIMEGETELGKKLSGRGDISFPREPINAWIEKGFNACNGHFDGMVKEIEEAYANEGSKSCNEEEKQMLLKKQQEFEASQREAHAERLKRDKAEKDKAEKGVWNKIFGSSSGNDEAEEGIVGEGGNMNDVGYFGIDGLVLGSAAPTPSPVLPELLPKARVWTSCVANAGVSPDFSSVSQEISRVRNAKGKVAETLRNETCLDDSLGTVGVPEDEFQFQWTAPVSDHYSGEYDEETGTTNVVVAAYDSNTPSPTLLSQVETLSVKPKQSGGHSFGAPPSSSTTASIPTQEVERIEKEEAQAMVGSNRGGIGGQLAISGRQGRTREVTQLLNRNNAGVWMIDDFLSSDECDALVEQARPGLRRATVNQEGDNQAVSAYRNSQAANVIPNWRNKSDPIARITRRIFAFANDMTGYGLTVDGQEPFSVIQYNEHQEYRPHCDGSCDGSPHLHAGRVATMLMYCRVAESGGGTSFTKAGVHVNPKKIGSAAFFAYKGRNGTMDTELTEHSGCPVAKGEKWVITQWLRLGVGKHDSWTKYDPIGGRL